VYPEAAARPLVRDREARPDLAAWMRAEMHPGPVRCQRAEASTRAGCSNRMEVLRRPVRLGRAAAGELAAGRRRKLTAGRRRKLAAHRGPEDGRELAAGRRRKLAVHRGLAAWGKPAVRRGQAGSPEQADCLHRVGGQAAAG
jgi:hypothetical protein